MNRFLKPFIHKKFGPVNAALYNIFNGDVFHITNDLSPKALMQNLEEGEMLYSTKGCKPLNIELPMPRKYENGLLRRVNIRLGLSDNGYCWDCKPQKEEVNEQVFNRIIEEIKGVYAETVFLDFYEYNLELIKPFLVNYKYSKVNIKTVVKLKKEELDKLNEIHDDIVIRDDFDFYNEDFSGNKYYYHKSFHPCLGHSMAIDNNGNVKPCLWFPQTLGNILDKSINDLKDEDKFNDYWTLSKHKIDECKECELSLSCNDCRALNLNKGLALKDKPIDCEYNPHIGVTG